MYIVQKLCFSSFKLINLLAVLQDSIGIIFKLIRKFFAFRAGRTDFSKISAQLNRYGHCKFIENYNVMCRYKIVDRLLGLSMFFKVYYMPGEIKCL